MENLILIIEDDKQICEMVRKALVKEGYRVNVAFNGDDGLREFRSKSYDLVILDIMMPKINGIEVLKEIRINHNTPIIMLSAKDSDVDKALGLGFGADDYLSKPFSLIELVARVEANIRRATKYSNTKETNSNTIEIGNIFMDFNSYEIKKNGESIKLTVKEFEILKLLVTNPNIVFTKNKIYERVWKEDAFGEENIINVHIRHIREKIEDDAKNPAIIKTVWGIGYKFDRKE
ncbi:response regulator transcription factor [Clostridium sp. MSJ-11]|uniref:Response regulator transcription factor n=1 Tax=Clostridium mobile TaxID=2841512 RepID=A0ABS6EGG3_9CLOT|nr:response regulator transcription factor [Clostridium mobile]MBU5484307.1 response regulator transcription factor [Clostridium mobile]